MSRRKSRDAIGYGQLIPQCPHGHPLDSLVLTRENVYRLDDPLRDGKGVPASLLPIGEKVKARCPACHEAGLQPDYQASWERVAELLTLERADTRSEQRVLELS